MSENDSIAAERAELSEVNQKPLLKRLGYYSKKSGPGWLQAAITLGGGSLAGSLFLGVILEYNLMWLQPLAMILGVIMLSAIAYVTLSSGRRPFGAVNQHVSPVLGWAWLIAAMMANIVWCLPQFGLGVGAIQQNLIPSLGAEGTKDWSQWVIGGVLFILAAIVVRSYGSGSKGVRIFEMILKVLVAVVVVSFFVVVYRLTASGALDWGRIFAGFIPNFSYLFEPAPAVAEAVQGSANADTWSGIIAGIQKDKIIAAFGTAVGINMTFLLPYSMLRKKWGKEHRGLAIFDLSVGLIIPFLLATGCIVIAAGNQFHGQFADILNEDGTVIEGQSGGYNSSADRLLGKLYGDEMKAAGAIENEEEKNAALAEIRNRLELPDRQIAAMLVDRKDKDLSRALSALGGGESTGQLIFGIGVLGMAISTIIILMLINGFCFCEAAGQPENKNLHFLGCLIPGLLGICFPLVWTGDSKAALAVPTSVIGTSLLPIAYFTFLLLMNSRTLLGDAMPKGARRVVWNIAMIIATSVATFGSVWALMGKNLHGFPLGKVGIGVLAVLFLLGLIGFIQNEKKAKSA